MPGYPEDDEPTPEKFLAVGSVPLPAAALTIGEHRSALVALLESRLSALDDERVRVHDAIAALRAL